MNWKRLLRHSIALSLSQCPAPDIEVTLSPGDALFIPATWFYWITSNTEKDSMNVAVNRWYPKRDGNPEFPFCLECEFGKNQDELPNKNLCKDAVPEPSSLMELWDLEDENLPVVFQFKEKTLNIDDLMHHTIPVHVTKSSTTQFASGVIGDVFPHLAQSVQMPLYKFFRKKDPHTVLEQCPIDGLDDIFGKSGTIPYKTQNLWVSFAEECESLCHCDEDSNILLQIRGTKTVRLWRPGLRDQLVMRVPIPSKELCQCVRDRKGKRSSFMFYPSSEPII
jgi:hypothetical protein